MSLSAPSASALIARAGPAAPRKDRESAGGDCRDGGEVALRDCRGGGSSAPPEQERPRRGRRGLVRRQRARITLAQRRSARLLLHVRGQEAIPALRDQRQRSGARRANRDVPPGKRAGGVSRPGRRVHVDRGRPGTAAARVGLLLLRPGDRAHHRAPDLRNRRSSWRPAPAGGGSVAESSTPSARRRPGMGRACCARPGIRPTPTRRSTQLCRGRGSSSIGAAGCGKPTEPRCSSRRNRTSRSCHGPGIPTLPRRRFARSPPTARRRSSLCTGRCIHRTTTEMDRSPRSISARPA